LCREAGCGSGGDDITYKSNPLGPNHLDLGKIMIIKQNQMDNKVDVWNSKTWRSTYQCTKLQCTSQAPAMKRNYLKYPIKEAVHDVTTCVTTILITFIRGLIMHPNPLFNQVLSMVKEIQI
jgi:hypothetical protein